MRPGPTARSGGEPSVDRGVRVAQPSAPDDATSPTGAVVEGVEEAGPVSRPPAGELVSRAATFGWFAQGR
jgi:hypothetical protein